jgi:hypothetical protein
MLCNLTLVMTHDRRRLQHHALQTSNVVQFRTSFPADPSADVVFLPDVPRLFNSHNNVVAR